MKTKFFPYLLAVLAVLLMPQLAFAADTLHPVNGNAWTLYVFGNGDAIFNIMNSIKLLMVPDSGSTGYNSLMMFLATVGFLVLAVQAGFDPGKNLMKMFTYILVVSAVHIMTMDIRANIRISDPVTNYENVVDKVPALVGVPAAIVSEVGHWFTKTVETYYTIPSELTVSGGTFNLFGRLMQESNEFVISNPELKKSLSAYVADCVVPAMAQGRITAADLMSSPNMTDTLARATHEAILTKYWPAGTPNTSGLGMTFPDSIMYKGESYPVQGGMGAVVPCAAAWGQLSTSMEAHAQELMNATAQQWSKTGVLVPFEQGMSSAMALASNGGGNAFAAYSKPQGYILQQAMLNSMNGSFRSAAASIGNNDILLSASIAQAEQNQKTSWFTAARVFTNMMGYVYTTLQAFIFAIVPIVIIALMVPGLGKSIFTNYAQILVWLTLWQPMLSIVNYLITLFGKAQIGSTVELAAGVTMQNKWILTENTNDLMLAAQFLGTSVPLLTWGLVKGSLAFTEFISHGIGSSMAQQAGATAASGNLSMGNMSMDNTSMNKFNTAMSSAVGAQTTMGYTGSMQSNFDAGGVVSQRMGGVQGATSQHQIQTSEGAAMKNALNASESVSHGLSALQSMAKDGRLSRGSSESWQTMASTLHAAQSAFQAAQSSGNSTAIKAAAQQLLEVGNLAQTQIEARAGANARIEVASDKSAVGGIASVLTGASVKAAAEISGSAGASANSNLAQRAARTAGWENGTSIGNNKGTSIGGGDTDQTGQTHALANQVSRDSSLAHSDSRSVSDALNKAVATSRSVEQTMQANQTSTVGISQSDRFIPSYQNQLDNIKNDVPANYDKITSGARDELKDVWQGTAADFKAMKQTAEDKYDHSPAAAAANLGPGPSSGMPQELSVTPGGVHVGNANMLGRAEVEKTMAEREVEAKAGDKAQATEFERVKGTGALGFAGERMMENVKGNAEAVKGWVK